MFDPEASAIAFNVKIKIWNFKANTNIESERKRLSTLVSIHSGLTMLASDHCRKFDSCCARRACLFNLFCH